MREKTILQKKYGIIEILIDPVLLKAAGLRINPIRRQEDSQYPEYVKLLEILAA